jgi:hypothetical protein
VDLNFGLFQEKHQMAKHRRYPVKNSRKYKMMNSQSKTVLSIGNVFDDLPPPKPAENIKNQR